MSGYLFKNVIILNCTGENPFPGDVLIKGNKIIKIARNGESLKQKNIQIIDGENRMILRNPQSSTRLGFIDYNLMVEQQGGK